MAPRLRKFVLTAHLASSVGWLGAVLVFLALDVTAVASDDVQSVRAAYAAMDMTTSYVIIPLAFGTLAIGVVNALGTPWGMFRHYWVTFKLALTAIAVLFLVTQWPMISYRAEERRLWPTHAVCRRSFSIRSAGCWCSWRR